MGLRQLAARPEGPHDFEDGDGEVYAHWALPAGITTGDLEVDIAIQHLTIKVKGVTIYDQELAHKVVPSQSSWTFDAPDVAVTLCKSMGRREKWGTLKFEEEHEKRA